MSVQNEGCCSSSPMGYSGPTVTLLSLPDEVLLLILSFLPPLDLYHCSLTTSRIARLTEDKSLVSKNLSFRRTKGLTPLLLNRLLSPGPRLASILKLNLNSAYWLPGSLVTDCVTKLKNLTDLHIVDIRLNDQQLISVLTSLTLRKLSLTWCYIRKEEVQNLTSSTLGPNWSRLEGLSIYLPPDKVKKRRGGILNLLTWVLALCSNLEQLAVFTSTNEVDARTYNANLTVSMRPMSFPCLKSLVLELDNCALSFLAVNDFTQSIVEAISSFQLKQVKSTSYAIELLNSTSSFLTGCVRRGNLRVENTLSEINEIAQKIHTSVLEQIEVEYLLSLPLPSLTELSVKFRRSKFRRSNNIKNLLAKKDWVNLKRLGLTTDNCTIVNFENPVKVIHRLDFPRLTSLALSLCCLLEEFEESELSEQVGNNDNDSSKQSSNTGILLLARKCPHLSHLELIGHHNAPPRAGCQLIPGEKLLETLPQFSKLRTLIIHKIHVVDFTPTQALFPTIFRSCNNLTELYISHLGNSCGKLVRDLALGLEVTQSLTILRVEQNQLTQFSPDLLTSLAKGCPYLDQLVLMDPSQFCTLSHYPVTELLDMVKTKDLSLLCVFSRLLTIEKIKKLKADLEKQCSPRLMSIFRREDLVNIPGVFLNTVYSLYIKITSNFAAGHGVQFDDIF